MKMAVAGLLAIQFPLTIFSAGKNKSGSRLGGLVQEYFWIEPDWISGGLEVQFFDPVQPILGGIQMTSCQRLA